MKKHLVQAFAALSLAVTPATAGTLTLNFYNTSGQALTFSQVQAIYNTSQPGAYPGDALIDPVTLQVESPHPMTTAGTFSFPLPTNLPTAFAINWPTATQGYGLVMIDNGGAGYSDDATVNFNYQAARDTRRRLDAALAVRPDYVHSTAFNTAYLLATNYLAAAEVSTNDSVKGAKGQLALDKLSVAYDVLLREYGPSYARVHTNSVTPWLGATLEDISNYQYDLNRLAAMAGPFAWVRIVFQSENAPSYYSNAIAYAKSKGIRILGTPVDSDSDGLITRAAFLQRFQDCVSAFPQIDAWEVGNEVNGGWASPDIAGRMADATAYCKSQGAKTYLTLFWQINTADVPGHATFNWIADNLPPAVRTNIDYVGLSQYQEQAPVGTAFDMIMTRLQAEFPTQQLGLGELGYWVTGEQYWWAYNPRPAIAKHQILEQYYKASLGYDRAYAGGFWWNFASSGDSYDFDSAMSAIVTGLKSLLLTPIPVPPVTITIPKNYLRVSNDVFTAQGTVPFNPYVTNVFYDLNGAGWMPVQTTNSWTNWSADLGLMAGTNVFRTFAQNVLGSTSTTNTVKFFYVVDSPITLLTNGWGSLTKAFTSTQLEVGRAYSVTAIPGPGQVFSNWVGGVTATNNPLGFLMQSNLVLQANFVTNPFIALKGTYTGLFYDTNTLAWHSSGLFTLTLGDHGAYSCYVNIGPYRYSFTGQFTVGGATGKIVLRPGTNALGFSLVLDLAPGANRITGSINGGDWNADMLANLATFNPRTNPATNYSGRYTLGLPGDQGNGSATVTIDTLGRVFTSGTLADGTVFSQSATLSQDGQWPFFASLYGGKGSLLGWLAVTNDTAQDLVGALNWIKFAQPGPFYPLGLTNGIFATGSRYAWVTTNRVLNLTNASISFSGGNMSTNFTNDLALSAKNVFSNYSSNRLTLSVVLPTGQFNGWVIDPAGARSVPFKGVLLQKQGVGLGAFTGTNQTGAVWLLPAD